MPDCKMKTDANPPRFRAPVILLVLMLVIVILPA
jgi:hypothetical protein